MAYDDSIKRTAKKRGLRAATPIERMNDASVAQMHALSAGILYPKEGPKATKRARNRMDIPGPAMKVVKFMGRLLDPRNTEYNYSNMGKYAAQGAKFRAKMAKKLKKVGSNPDNRRNVP